ncbi:hypothetical protein C2E23DRAFT_861600 [Lenzites betulinus]|nr:hypothetical protein C2E23DRAFT_861600 [Lenzites betulinus]
MNSSIASSSSVPVGNEVLPYAPDRTIPHFPFLTQPLYLEPSNPLVNRYFKQEIMEDGTRYYSADDTLAQAVWFHLLDTAGKIVAASQSYLPGTTVGPLPTEIRSNACAELGLDEPRILRITRGANPLVGRRTPEDWWRQWGELQQVGREAMTWIDRATRRTRELQGCSEWVWDSADLTTRLLRLRDMACTTMINHPIYGRDAEAALVPYRPSESLRGPTSPTPPPTVASLCRELILHPVLSSGAPNQVVLYRGQTTDPRRARDPPPPPANSPDFSAGPGDDSPVTGEDIFGGGSDDDSP